MVCDVKKRERKTNFVFFSIVYFLISGRVNYVCGQQSIAFKTIIEKSYFGEIEIFHNTSRLFSARAQTECNLLTIKKKVF
jgi:CRP-like cAMP-binding protein